MDVDPATPVASSSLKRPADFPASSSADKRAKTLLPHEQLTTISSNMDEVSSRKLWKTFVDRAVADDSGSLWPDILSAVLMHLHVEFRSTNMKGANIKGAYDIVKSFNKDELEAWKVGVRNGVERKDWNDLLARPEFTILNTPNIAPTFEESRQQEQATKKSWERPYVGQAAEALWTHIRSHYNTNKQIYEHSCSVVQSSGMGKSRTVDELGKKCFSIPINLRDAQSTGYPPADLEVLNFLTIERQEEPSYRRACCFIDALFEHTDHTLQNFDSQWEIEKVACEFRIRMTEGQTMQQHNVFRRDFYQRVVEIAEEKIKVTRPGSDERLGYMSPSGLLKDAPFLPAVSCGKLIESLKARKSLSAVKKVSGETDPLVILAFDEAHTLTWPAALALTKREATGYATWSNYSVLRHVLRALHNFPLFALFLSTMGNISQFISPNEDTSGRIIIGDLKLIQPYTDLGFDTLANKVVLDGHWNLERVTEDSHIVHMGRPLFGSRYDAGNPSVQEAIVTFAVGKLLNADPSTQNLTLDQMLACLSQRLPIQFNSTTYISQTSEWKQVERHMRVCLKIDAAFESMETISSSEPLLSEAAYVIMARESFDPLQSFKSVLEGFAVHKGDRGEFLVLLLLTLARDRAVGPPDHNGRPERRFFDFASFMYGHLFSESPSPSELQKLKSEFPNAMMHFNHFVKLHDFKSIDKECLLLLMTRGAGVLCANKHPSIDAVNVFLPSGTKLTIDNLGLILHQVKNDAIYTHIPKWKLFESMNPYDLGILKEGDAPVPVIRIFFALAAKTPSLHVNRHDPSPNYDAVIYDIWSAGLSSEFLSPIDSRTTIWDALLQASYGWKEIYKAPTKVEKEIRSSMNPGAADDDGHWSHWAAE
ncbi:hypothetical protein M378DRAFT_9526 [Amanita muscaria Koide BX008]|uniref:Uncharacterized protein n=1 Tax=Amanita muscaria (strain Koide BX008) TaxID=946122 RepID=A0A0C2XCX3_AMAMK|nr:hypothetical protein M378DRAFT_9526 [Amanita muscaria Koide BX008]